MQSHVKSIKFVIQLQLMMMNRCKILIFTFVSLFATSGAFASANVDSLVVLADKQPKNAALNLKAGKALLESGNILKSRLYLEKGGNEALPWLAQIDFDSYRFDEAEAKAQKYLDSKHDEASASHAASEKMLDCVELARTMLDRVERVIVIDSMTVGKDDFFRAYRISATSGRVADRSVLPRDFPAAQTTTVYVSENGDNMMWGAVGHDGKVNIVESAHLADNSWENPHEVSDNLQLGGNANFPFLLSDGMTLYYASDGEGSLGGYDIYVTRNDGDRYLNPQNLGMPYNSPFNDYLLAIDDVTGVGWWATDRNMMPDSVTIYVFIPQELRDNYPVDGTPDLIDRARLTSIAATHRHGEDYSRYREAIKALPVSVRSAKSAPYFAFSLPDGRVLTSIEQFAEPLAADLMTEYLEAKEEYESRKKALRSLRNEYGKGNKSVSDRILSEEKELEQFRLRLRSMSNAVIKAETER